ncbi:MAG: hypothetical protein JXB07_09885, partial [Anaerolineae bacterium]|nr:hypothetical protein [Anaerolineae bacterium]
MTKGEIFVGYINTKEHSFLAVCRKSNFGQSSDERTGLSMPQNQRLGMVLGLISVEQSRFSDFSD